MNNQGICQRPVFGLEDLGNCQGIKGVASQSVHSFRGNSHDLARAQQPDGFPDALTARQNPRTHEKITLSEDIRRTS